jgi:hypothetical protein
MFNLGNATFEKGEGRVTIKFKDGINMIVMSDDDWISVMTAMSAKPQNAEQHKNFEKLHFGKKK